MVSSISKLLSREMEARLFNTIPRQHLGNGAELWIDGADFAHFILKNSDAKTQYGGNYMGLGDTLERMVNSWLGQGFFIHIVVDGLNLSSFRKKAISQDEWAHRLEYDAVYQMLSGQMMMSDGCALPPPHMLLDEVYGRLKLLAEKAPMNISLLQARGEAVVVLAQQCASKLRAGNTNVFCVSEKADFYFMKDVQFISFKDLRLGDGCARVVTVDKVAQIFGISSVNLVQFALEANMMTESGQIDELLQKFRVGNVSQAKSFTDETIYLRQFFSNNLPNALTNCTVFTSIVHHPHTMGNGGSNQQQPDMMDDLVGTPTSTGGGSVAGTPSGGGGKAWRDVIRIEQLAKLYIIEAFDMYRSMQYPGEGSPMNLKDLVVMARDTLSQVFPDIYIDSLGNMAWDWEKYLISHGYQVICRWLLRTNENNKILPEQLYSCETFFPPFIMMMVDQQSSSNNNNRSSPIRTGVPSSTSSTSSSMSTKDDVDDMYDGLSMWLQTNAVPGTPRSGTTPGGLNSNGGGPEGAGGMLASSPLSVIIPPGGSAHHHSPFGTGGGLFNFNTTPSNASNSGTPFNNYSYSPSLMGGSGGLSGDLNHQQQEQMNNNKALASRRKKNPECEYAAKKLAKWIHNEHAGKTFAKHLDGFYKRNPSIGAIIKSKTIELLATEYPDIIAYDGRKNIVTAICDEEDLLALPDMDWSTSANSTFSTVGAKGGNNNNKNTMGGKNAKQQPTTRTGTGVGGIGAAAASSPVVAASSDEVATAMAKWLVAKYGGKTSTRNLVKFYLEDPTASAFMKNNTLAKFVAAHPDIFDLNQRKTVIAVKGYGSSSSDPRTATSQKRETLSSILNKDAPSKEESLKGALILAKWVAERCNGSTKAGNLGSFYTEYPDVALVVRRRTLGRFLMDYPDMFTWEPEKHLLRVISSEFYPSNNNRAGGSSPFPLQRSPSLSSSSVFGGDDGKSFLMHTLSDDSMGNATASSMVSENVGEDGGEASNLQILKNKAKDIKKSKACAKALVKWITEDYDGQVHRDRLDKFYSLHPQKGAFIQTMKLEYFLKRHPNIVKFDPKTGVISVESNTKRKIKDQGLQKEAMKLVEGANGGKTMYDHNQLSEENLRKMAITLMEWLDEHYDGHVRASYLGAFYSANPEIARAVKAVSLNKFCAKFPDLLKWDGRTYFITTTNANPALVNNTTTTASKTTTDSLPEEDGSLCGDAAAKQPVISSPRKNGTTKDQDALAKKLKKKKDVNRPRNSKDPTDPRFVANDIRKWLVGAHEACTTIPVVEDYYKRHHAVVADKISIHDLVKQFPALLVFDDGGSSIRSVPPQRMYDNLALPSEAEVVSLLREWLIQNGQNGQIKAALLMRFYNEHPKAAKVIQRVRLNHFAEKHASCFKYDQEEKLLSLADS